MNKKTVKKKSEREEKFEIRKQRSDQEASAMMNVTDLSEEEKSEETYPLTHPLMRNTLKVKQKRKEQRIMLLSDFLGRFCLVIHSSQERDIKLGVRQ